MTRPTGWQTTWSDNINTRTWFDQIIECHKPATAEDRRRYIIRAWKYSIAERVRLKLFFAIMHACRRRTVCTVISDMISNQNDIVIWTVGRVVSGRLEVRRLTSDAYEDDDKMSCLDVDWLMSIRLLHTCISPRHIHTTYRHLEEVCLFFFLVSDGLR
jgi:hypothetical protein